MPGFLKGLKDGNIPESGDRGFLKQLKAQAPPPEPPKPSFGSKVLGGIKDGINWIGDQVKSGVPSGPTGAERFNAGSIEPVKQIGRDLLAGVGDFNKSFYGVLKSVGGDKIPLIKNVVNTGFEGAQGLSEKGGVGIGSQVVRSLPGAGFSAGLALMTGGASAPAQLGANATLEAVKGIATSPTFINSALQSYGGAYNEARDAGVNRGTAILSAVTQALPQALIEQSGGLEKLPQTAAKEGLLKTIGKSALEEGLEEIYQYPFEGLAKKAFYAPDTPIFSTKEEAVINPVQMAQAGIVGAAAGGLMGGAGKIANDFMFNGAPAPQVDRGNILRQVAELSKAPEVPIKPQTNFYVDPYGNTVTDVNKAPLLLHAPATESETFVQQPTNKFTHNRFTPAQLQALNKRGFEVEPVAKLSDRLANLNPPISQQESVSPQATDIKQSIQEQAPLTVKEIKDSNLSKAAKRVLSQMIIDGDDINYVANDMIEHAKRTQSMYNELNDESMVKKYETELQEWFSVKDFLQSRDTERTQNQLQNMTHPAFTSPVDPDVRIEGAPFPAKQQINETQQQAVPTIDETQPKRKYQSEILQKHQEAKRLRHEYQLGVEEARLTPDELQIAEQVRKGRMKLEHAPNFDTPKIREVIAAGIALDNAHKEVKDFNIKRKQALRDTMGDLLINSDDAKDKAGWTLARETQERNSIDVFGEETGKRINDTVFRPVHENEARGTRFVNKYIDRVKQLNLTKDESAAVQALGEGKIKELELPNNIDKAKVNEAVKEFRTIYNELFDLANDVLVKNGYNPVEYRKDYFPHFEDPKDPFVKAMKQLGFQVDNIELPTDIAGITHQFRPGKKWFGNFMQRISDNTDYDALGGFERYIHGIKDVIYHTYDIQRLRSFETAIRSKYAPDNIKNRIAEIDASDLSVDEKQSAIDALFDIDKGHLGSYVTNLRNYTDSLAGKKSQADRNAEHMFGRGMYNIMTNLENQVAKNMIGFNVSSWLTNFIPIVQGGAGIKTQNLIQAAKDTAMSFYNDDGFSNKSTFLTNRKGTDRLTKTTIQKISDTASAPMQWIDDFASNVVTRGRYLDEISRGKSPAEAMKIADAYAASVISDRSKGALPTVFNNKNPISKLFTVFQVEVNNQLSFMFKDLPREAKELGVKWMAATIMKFLVGSFFANEMYVKLAGRRPFIDPVGTVKKMIESENPLLAASEDVLDQTPFISGLVGGGRLPINSALPDVGKMIKGEANIGKELLKPVIYGLSPIGGGNQARKTIEGIGAFKRGASVTDKGNMRFPIEQTPANAIRTGLFGQYSTPESREYFDENRKPLSDKQTQATLSSQDPKWQYEQFVYKRELDGLISKIQDIANDPKLSQEEKDKRISNLQQKIFDLRAAQ